MPESDTQTIDEEDNSEELPEPARKRLRDLEAKDKQAVAEIAELRRLNALHEAGIKVTDLQRKALFASHEGEDLSPDALQKTATELGFYQAPPEVDPEVSQAHDRIAQASQGAQTGDDRATYEAEILGAKSAREMEDIARKHGVAWDNSAID